MLTGKLLINGEWVEADAKAESPDIEGFGFYEAGRSHVDEAAKAARASFREYSGLSREVRANFLDSIGEEIEKLAHEITDICGKETGLPEARLNGERGRTVGQLKLFADLIRGDDHLDIRIDEALADRQPLPRPDLRLTHRPIGPVVVFGASNFPLAFSTAGGDTASALAAGCPVIIKGHPAHAGTGELVAQAINSAMVRNKIPLGTFQFLQGTSHEFGAALVQHPEIVAVGFTGSLAGGRALYDLCAKRPKPIPFYGELGSINPVFLLPGALNEKTKDIAEGWVASLTMGAGQFCTNPGVVFAVKGAKLNEFEEFATSALKGVGEQKMLTDNIHSAFERNTQSVANILEVGSCHDANGQRCALPVLFKTDAQKWLSTPELQEEIFGAAGIVVSCENTEELLLVAEQLEGQLTATLHLEESDTELASKLAIILEEKAGRLLCNGFPTGVEVCSAMMHGGPYPASTDVRSTSVGTLAINRFLRPVSYQNFPDALLHPELKRS